MGKIIHFDKTYEWALEMGFSKTEAKKIARANLCVDERKRGKRYERGRHTNTRLLSRLDGRPSQLIYADRHLEAAIGNNSLEELGTGLHSLQDWIGHGEWPLYGKHWRGPWRIKIKGREIRLRKYDPDSDLGGGRLERLERQTKEYMARFLEATRQTKLASK